MSKRNLLKAYPFLEGVDGFSIQAALGLYKVRPHWLNYAYLAEWEGNKYWEIKIESSFEPNRRRIVINSNDYRMSLYHFDWFHFHYGINKRHPKMEDVIRYMFEFIDGYCREEWLVAYRLNNGRVEGGRTFPQNMLSEQDLSEFQYLASWLGTYDKKLLED
jgi:hypothetical protein